MLIDSEELKAWAEKKEDCCNNIKLEDLLNKIADLEQKQINLDKIQEIAEEAIMKGHGYSKKGGSYERD